MLEMLQGIEAFQLEDRARQLQDRARQQKEAQQVYTLAVAELRRELADLKSGKAGAGAAAPAPHTHLFWLQVLRRI